MDVSDIGTKCGIDCIDEYNAKGLILDSHLSGKLPYADAVSWAREMHAEEVLALLLGTYRPPTPWAPLEPSGE